jgi:thioredoxin 1
MMPRPANHFNIIRRFGRARDDKLTNGEFKMPLRELTEKNYGEAIASSGEVLLIEFGAEHCAPCKALAPLLEKLSDELGVPAYSSDIDENPALGAKFGIRSLPTLIAMRGGKESGRLAGRISREDIMKLLL